MFSRRIVVAGLVGLATPAWAAAPAARSPAGLPIEPLEIVTGRGARHAFKVELAETDAARARGLMERPPLPDDAGMLFDFKSPRPVAFWMKNTPSPLDIVFIDSAGRILNIAKQTTPYSEAPIPSRGSARAVLEIRGGRTDELDIRPGDRVRHRIFP